jgi:CubicO group peptidase (beta-lactamase class C family)
MLKTTTIDAIAALAEQSRSAQCCLMVDSETLIDLTFQNNPVDIFAVQKGFLTLLLGVAEELYLLETIDNVNHHLAPEWTQLAPWDEAKLSIETLLTMTTGMDDELALLGEINKTWRYNNTAYQYLKEILCQQSDQSLQELSQAWLLGPLNMQATRWIDRPQILDNGRPFTGLLSTAADLARLGQFVLARGKLGDRAVVADYFMSRMFEPGSEENPAWGWGWWNNLSSHYLEPMREQTQKQGSIIADAPGDLVAARGAYGNYLHVVPSLKLVMARTCERQPEKPTIDFEKEVWSLLKNQG